MHIRIVAIDFRTGCARVDMEAFDSGPDLERLATTLATIRAAGCSELHVVHRAATSSIWMRALDRVARKHDTTLSRSDEGEWAVPDSDAGDILWSERSRHDAAGSIYRMRLSNFDRAVDRVTVCAAVTSLACGLDPAVRHRLRFGLYELTVNTVEHGVFSVTQPQIHASINVLSGSITLTYKDNSDPFNTVRHASLDVEGKIASGHKRGLGLYILNRICEDAYYNRVGRWNVTTLTIPGASAPAVYTTRRKTMDGITVETVPCTLEGTTLLKPIGSIDSTTAQVVESHLNSAIDQGDTRVILDLSEVEFVSSAGVGIFLGTVSRLRQSGGDLIFMRTPSHITEVFDIINLSSFFHTIDNIDELEHVARKS